MPCTSNCVRALQVELTLQCAAVMAQVGVSRDAVQMRYVRSGDICERSSSRCCVAGGTGEPPIIRGVTGTGRTTGQFGLRA